MEFIRKHIFDLAGIQDDLQISYQQNADSLSVELNGKTATIGYATKAQASRAHFLLAKAIREGKTSFSVTQKPAFNMVGVMINASSAMPKPRRVCSICAINWQMGQFSPVQSWW